MHSGQDTFRSSSNKMTRMYYFMLQLSVADIITAVFTMLPEVLWTLFGLPVHHPGNYRQESKRSF